MSYPSYLTGLNAVESEILNTCRSLAPDEKTMLSAPEILRIVSKKMWDMDEEDSDEDINQLSIEVPTLADCKPESIAQLYRLMLRMGLPWHNRYPLLDLGGIVGDFHDEIPFGPNDVELRLSKHAHVLLPEKDRILLPLFLLNGKVLKEGLHIPSHNLEELWMAMEQVRQSPDISLEDLMEVMPGPDFGPGGIVGDIEAVRALYETGEARLRLRGQIEPVIEGGRTRIAIRSLPQGVLMHTILRQVGKVLKAPDIRLYTLKKNMVKMSVNVLIDVAPSISAEALKQRLYDETDLEYERIYRLVTPSETGAAPLPLIEVLKQAVSQCHVAWVQKNGQKTDYLPLMRDVAEHGGYTNPMTQLSDERRTAILRMDQP